MGSNITVEDYYATQNYGTTWPSQPVPGQALCYPSNQETVPNMGQNVPARDMRVPRMMQGGQQAVWPDVATQNMACLNKVSGNRVTRRKSTRKPSLDNKEVQKSTEDVPYKTRKRRYIAARAKREKTIPLFEADNFKVDNTLVDREAARDVAARILSTQRVTELDPSTEHIDSYEAATESCAALNKHTRSWVKTEISAQDAEKRERDFAEGRNKEICSPAMREKMEAAARAVREEASRKDGESSQTSSGHPLGKSQKSPRRRSPRQKAAQNKGKLDKGVKKDAKDSKDAVGVRAAVNRRLLEKRAAPHDAKASDMEKQLAELEEADKTGESRKDVQNPELFDSSGNSKCDNSVRTCSGGSGSQESSSSSSGGSGNSTTASNDNENSTGSSSGNSTGTTSSSSNTAATATTTANTNQTTATPTTTGPTTTPGANLVANPPIAPVTAGLPVPIAPAENPAMPNIPPVPLANHNMMHPAYNLPVHTNGPPLPNIGQPPLLHNPIMDHLAGLSTPQICRTRSRTRNSSSSPSTLAESVQAYATNPTAMSYATTVGTITAVDDPNMTTGGQAGTTTGTATGYASTTAQSNTTLSSSQTTANQNTASSQPSQSSQSSQPSQSQQHSHNSQPSQSNYQASSQTSSSSHSNPPSSSNPSSLSSSNLSNLSNLSSLSSLSNPSSIPPNPFSQTFNQASSLAPTNIPIPSTTINPGMPTQTYGLPYLPFSPPQPEQYQVLAEACRRQISILRGGVTVIHFASEFVGLAESTVDALFATSSDALETVDFLERLYEQYLHRSADENWPMFTTAQQDASLYERFVVHPVFSQDNALLERWVDRAWSNAMKISMGLGNEAGIGPTGPLFRRDPNNYYEPTGPFLSIMAPALQAFRKQVMALSTEIEQRVHQIRQVANFELPAVQGPGLGIPGQGLDNRLSDIHLDMV